MPEFKHIIFLFSFCIVFHTGCFLFPDDDSPGTKAPTTDTAHPCIPSTNRSEGYITVSEVTGELTSVPSPNGLSEKFTLNLRACIKGRLAEQIFDASFWISSNEETIIKYEEEENEELRETLKETENSLLTADNKLIQVVGDKDGCLKWTEEYDYTHKKQSQWFISNRLISGRSRGFIGTHIVPLIVNPRLQLLEYKKVQDYRPKYKDKSIEQHVHETECLTQRMTPKKSTATTKKNTEKYNIIVDKVDFTGRQSTENNERYIKVNIDAHVKTLTTDIHGKQTDNILDRGQFIIKPMLLIMQDEEIIGENKPIYKQLNEHVQEVKTQFRDNVLASDVFDWEIPIEAYDFPITLYLQVIPVGETAERINVFEGIYRIGQYFKDIEGEKTLSLYQELNEYYRNRISLSTEDTDSLNITTTESDTNDPLVACVQENNNINQMVIEHCISKKKLTKYTDGSKEAGWVTDEIKMGFLQVHAENWLSRTIQTQVRTNIFDPFDNDRKSLRDIDIKVTDLTTGKVEKPLRPETEGAGNITFTISTFQNWYKRQRYFLKLIHFSNPTDKMNLYKIIAINPWDYGFTHGYDVTQSQSLSTTCLDKNNDKEQRKTVKQLFEDIAETNNNVPTSFDPTLIKKIFCYEDDRSTNEEQRSSWWAEKFKEIKKILSAPFREAVLTGPEPSPEQLTDAFFKKFDSSMKKTRPHSFIHLFRNLNTYPSYLVDSSLNRDFYYNMRFTVTPRVVRYDDIRAGQQNKGPIRDGIYLFEMAVLKNEQEKSNGLKNMVLVNANPSIIETQHNGDIPLFRCINKDGKMENLDCLKEEDFLFPPKRIPVIIRDGIMKTDIKFLIERKNLMFANSKNELIFRLLPTDPESIVCDDGDCDSIDNLQYEDNLDWEATVKGNPQPANPKDYDMYFHTYRTPFIPSEWNNWMIANEMSPSFTKLNELYDQLTKSYKDKNSDLETMDNYVNQERTAGVSFENAEKFVTNEKETIGKLIEVDPKFDPQSMKTRSEKLDTTMTEISLKVSDADMAQATSTIPLLEHSTETDANNIQDITTESIANSAQEIKTKKDFCLEVKYQNIYLYKDKGCDEPDIENRMDAHLSYFARNNALCVMDINSDGTQASELSEESCGDFSNAQEAQATFLNDLNRQIDIINNVRQEVKDKLLFPTNDQFSTVGYLANNPSSSSFKNKIKKLPQLPTLSAQDIENIINDGFTKNTNIKSTNISTFIHALCGLWFDKFLSKEYTNTNLLLNGFRKSMKKTLYYNLKDLSLPEDQGEEGDERDAIKGINKSVAEMRTNYNKQLEEQNRKGYIDSIHNWIDDEGTDSFDSNFHEKLREKFTRIAEATPLSNKEPSWTEPSAWNKAVAFVTGEENEDTDNSKNFQLADYLHEAIIEQNREKTIGVAYWSGVGAPDRQPRDSDLHPVRKCISNPFHFFGFEKKVIVGEVGKDSRYGNEESGEGGTFTTLNISEEFLFNSQKEQGGRQGFETNITADAFILALPLILLAATGIGALFTGAGLLTAGGLFSGLALQTGMWGYILSHLFTASLMTGAGYNYQSYENVSRDKMTTLRVSNAVTLIAEETNLTFELNDYKECLVVRPRFSAFETYTGKYEHIWATDNKILRSIYENIGVLLCSNGKDPERKITEHYYYVYPNYTINGITSDPRNIHNKPFIISLRGQNEWKKFTDSLNCYVSGTAEHMKTNQTCMDPEKGNFEYLFTKNIEFANNLKRGFYTPRLMHLTGHSPGVHSVNVKETETAGTPPSKTAAQNFMNFWTERFMMDMDIEGIMRDDTEVQ